MSEKIDSLKNLIIAANLADLQKEMWMNFVNRMTDAEIEALHDLFVEEDDALNFLTSNLESKMEALKNGDVEAAKKIVEEELAYLNALD